VLSRCAPVERAPFLHEWHAGSPQPLDQSAVGEGDDFLALRFDVAVQVTDQVSEAGRLRQVARPGHYHFFGGRDDDVGAVRRAMQDLAGAQDGAGRQRQRKLRPVRSHDETTHAPPIRRGHRDLDRRRFRHR
jgi:hypothetical protein